MRDFGVDGIIITSQPYMNFYRRKAIYSLLIILAAAVVSTAQAQTHSLSSSTATTTPLVITRSLHVGESGDDVLALQSFLRTWDTSRIHKPPVTTALIPGALLPNFSGTTVLRQRATSVL